jgi:diaminohydroxyphosphoribosylaminopyrimidine deaminase/5-amino-6-(5-phosphoribosylamino)uracil reductase
MLRCIQLAENGLGNTYPNPLVGSVIVYENKIIGEGWHYQSGMPHAEVNAIASVKNQSLLKDATIYVSLEPCSHFGKTPPCANLIIEKGIKNIIIGSMDPNPKVAGNGIKLLKDHGSYVVERVLEKECNKLNKRFFTFFKKQRPYIILKWAETSDGFISPKGKTEKRPVWITNKKSRQLVHKWRAEESSILIGTNTAIEDNPSLTTRDWEGNSPIRLVIDKSLKIPIDANVFDFKARTIIITEVKKENEKNVIYELIDFSKNIATQIIELIYRYKIQSLIVEGGAKTLQTFIDKNLWDEARIIKGIPFFKEGIKAPFINGKICSESKIKQDTFKIILND